MSISLDSDSISELYKGSVKNRKCIRSAIKQSRRRINEYMKKNNDHCLKLETLHFATLFLYECEALLLEVITFENAFSTDNVIDILSRHTLEDKWRTAFDLAVKQFDWTVSENLLQVPISNAQEHHKQVIGDFNGLLEEHLLKPIRIRNKICHGQPVVAFSESWRLNQESTTALDELKSDDVETDWIVLERMARILGELIKSPDKAHPRDYEKEIGALLDEVVRRNESTFTESRKKKLLQKKYEKKLYSTRGAAV